MPKCTESKVGNPPKCSDFYHDHEQTPSNGDKSSGPTKYDGWTVWQPYNGVGGHLQLCDSANHSSDCQVWVAPGRSYADWESCSKAADAAMAINPLITTFTWWKNPGDNATQGSCWLSQHLYKGTGGPEQGHVMGYKGPASERPEISNYNVCDGDCDCGESLPCGEYLWDHRNGTMLRKFLIDEFILNDKTGLGNKAVSGFFFGVLHSGVQLESSLVHLLTLVVVFATIMSKTTAGLTRRAVSHLGRHRHTVSATCRASGVRLRRTSSAPLTWDSLKLIRRNSSKSMMLL